MLSLEASFIDRNIESEISASQNLKENITVHIQRKRVSINYYTIDTSTDRLTVLSASRVMLHIDKIMSTCIVYHGCTHFIVYHLNKLYFVNKAYEQYKNRQHNKL